MRRSSRRQPLRFAGLKLTDRHIETLQLVLQLRLATLEQIQIGAGYPLGPKSLTATQRPLTKMVRNKLLSTLPRASTDPAIYLINKESSAGLSILQKRFGKAYVTSHLTKIGYKPHILALSDIRVRIARSCRENGYTLDFWSRPQDIQFRLKRDSLQPDGFFKITVNWSGWTTATCAFVELERRNTLKELAWKFERYANLYHSGRYIEQFGFQSIPRVLVLFESDDDRESDKKLMAAMRAANKVGITFAWCADLSKIAEECPSSILTASLWSTPIKTQKMSFIEEDGN
jgi:hypothetical protein